MLPSDAEGWFSRTVLIQNKGRKLAYCWELDNDSSHDEIDGIHQEACCLCWVVRYCALERVLQNIKLVIRCLDGICCRILLLYPLLSMVDRPSERRSTEQHHNGWNDEVLPPESWHDGITSILQRIHHMWEVGWRVLVGHWTWNYVTKVWVMVVVVFGIFICFSDFDEFQTKCGPGQSAHGLWKLPIYMGWEKVANITTGTYTTVPVPVPVPV